MFLWKKNVSIRSVKHTACICMLSFRKVCFVWIYQIEGILTFLKENVFVSSMHSLCIFLPSSFSKKMISKSAFGRDTRVHIFINTGKTRSSRLYRIHTSTREVSTFTPFGNDELCIYMHWSSTSSFIHYV